jgi:diguanylate cyclase (GGDEF)-like protein
MTLDPSRKPLLSEEELTREERWINTVAIAGGFAVTIVTLGLLLFLLMSADHVWEYALYPALGGVPLAYAIFSNFVVRQMQVSLLHRYQAQLVLRLTDLQEMVSRDELTGLYNRRHFYQVIERELQKARMTKEPLALIIMDLDGLKTINDEYGHGVGDIVLANLGKAITKVTRGDDLPARLGGDEFGVVMPGTDKRGAFALAQRLWKELEHTPMYNQDGKTIMVTISVGVAGYPWGGETLEELLQWADADMYANKVSRKLPPQMLVSEVLSDLDSLPDDHVVGI